MNILVNDKPKYKNVLESVGAQPQPIPNPVLNPTPNPEPIPNVSNITISPTLVVNSEMTKVNEGATNETL